jgi:hypothetical protein
MRKLLLTSLVVICLLAVAPAQPDTPYAFTTGQLQSALRQAGLTTQQLHSVQTFGSGNEADPAYLTVLSSSRSGWHVSVFHHAQGRFKLEWASGKLPIEFSVSSANNFSLSDIGEETTVTFSGCAPHRCGGDYHGFLLYSTVRKEVFFALLAQPEDQHRQVTFSQNALEPRNNAYKQALQSAADEIIRRTDIR